MRKTALSIALAGALSFPLAAAAQGLHAEINLQLPAIIPPMVVIQPGVQVIPEINHEVFFVDGAYYARQGGGWYRAPSPRAERWVGVPVQAVPVALVKLPPGHYKNWKAEKEQRKAERKEAKAEEKAYRKSFKKHGKH
jgi:hypothetical protein